jgi:hypothetical protein
MHVTYEVRTSYIPSYILHTSYILSYISSWLTYKHLQLSYKMLHRNFYAYIDITYDLHIGIQLSHF